VVDTRPRGGPEALRERPRPGAPRRLTTAPLARWPALLHQGAEAYGVRGQGWPCGRIAAVIRLACGLSDHPVHVGRLCHALGWSPPKPARRARQQKGAQAQQQPLCVIDEAGGSPLPRAVRTEAPVSPTPLLREWWTRAHLWAIGTLSPEGKRSVACQDQALNAEDVSAWLGHLLREVPGRLVIRWEGAPMHRRHVGQALLRTGAAPGLCARAPCR
jgi:transposase